MSKKQIMKNIEKNSKNNITTDESSNNIVIHSGNSDTITIDDIGITFNLESGKLHFLNQ